MRASPPCEISLGRAPVWRLAIAAVTLTALASLAAWAALAPQGASTVVRLALALGGVAIVGLAMMLARVDSGRLVWDGARWNLATSRAGRSVTAIGDLAVAIDLGSFLLLRLVAESGSRPAVRWLAVERLGREHVWHAFRCAVYSPRPAAGPAVGAGLRATE